MGIISTECISVYFGGLAALKDINMNVERGEIRGIIGPNGAGKSTLLNVICGITPANNGKVFFRGEDITRLKPYQIASRGISRTFQMVQLFPNMTVLENLMTGFHYLMTTNIFSAAFSSRKMWLEETMVRKKALETLRFMNIEDLSDRFASELSFGQQRIVEICRALVSEPRILLLDEPAAGLSEARISMLNSLLKKIREEKGVTIILVEHVIKLVFGISDQITVLNNGEKIAEGKPEEVCEDRAVIQAYLGKGYI